MNRIFLEKFDKYINRNISNLKHYHDNRFKVVQPSTRLHDTKHLADFEQSNQISPQVLPCTLIQSMNEIFIDK